MLKFRVLKGGAVEKQIESSILSHVGIANIKSGRKITTEMETPN